MNSKLISGARVIDPAQSIDGQFDLLISEDGKVEGLEKAGSIVKADARVVDASGLILAPGLIDIHVHLRDPGQEWKETIETGVKAAVAGGFTRVCCMPNTLPVNDHAEITEYILEEASRVNLSQVSPIGSITKGLKGEDLAPYLELVEAGAVAFSDDGMPVSNPQIMRRALEYCLMLGTVLTVHEEDLALSDGFSMNESALSLKMGLKGMSDAAENVMIARDIELARLTGGRVHFCHVSTARGVQLIRRAKEDGIPVTAEVAPHHFTLDETAVVGFNTESKMSMPLRKQEDIEALLQGLEEGVIDCVASDHAPHENDSKNVEFDKASFGILGLQTTLPLTLARVRDGHLSLQRAIESLTTSAAKSLNLEVPSLAVGKKADLVLIDENRKLTLKKEHILSKSKNTPFYGWELQGLAVKTFISGREVYDIDKGVLASE